MVQKTAKHMHNEMQFTWTDLEVGYMGHYNMGKRKVKDPHKLGHRTSQLVKNGTICPYEPHGIIMMILVVVGGRFIARYVSLRKTTIHN